jgi:RHS repeat-associated protein
VVVTRRAPWRRFAAAVGSIVILFNGMPAVATGEPLGGADQTTLAREPQLTPGQLGDGSIDGLQYPDPTEGLALITPPEVANDGGAHLAYPLIIPKGRGIAPDLSLVYDSGGANGWVGLGWDLSVGEISVDTRWGAPYFSASKESETYLLDGDMLIPNALGATWADRVHGDRQDYTRQVETEYAQIIRHEVGAGGPANYYWEVHDKQGNVFWYGGYPDTGGPIGTPLKDAGGNDLTIDRSAIVTDEHGNGVRWLLSAQRDVGVNLIRYHYTTLTYANGANGWVQQASCTPSATILCARHTYLSSIEYTAAAAQSGEPEDPAYRVVFKRESEVHPNTPLRADPIVDAMGGFVDLTIDRLARVEVDYGAPNQPNPNQPRQPRTYDQLAVRYDLAYATGAFGKSLLASVTQVGSDGTTSTTHTFDYYNRVGTQQTGYDGFGSVVDWNTGSDLPDRLLLDSSASIGALGSSESNSAEGHAYIGFNPVDPLKVGSFGGSLQIGGGATEAIAEWLDINGDGLPDKVYRDSDGTPNPADTSNTSGDANDTNRDGPIRFRLNQSGPNGSTTFGPEQTVTGITRLSTEGNFGLEGAFEAFPGATVAFGLGAEVSWGDAYFSDVNADGLPDYVSGGKVWFNHLVGGVPTFEQGSGNTPVPVEDASATSPLPQAVQDIQAQLAADSPLVDTVRRWTAPFKGTISILAPVTLDPSNGTSLDGVRVAIQHDATELVSANLLSTGSSAFTSAISVAVKAGDDIYFRVGSVNDGTNDEVAWSPTISYASIDGVADIGTVPSDVNGLSQTTFVAADDFTLSGRPDSQYFMPFAGTVRFAATIDKATATTDDLHLVLRHNGTTVPGSDVTIPAAFTGSMPVQFDFAVAAPVQPTEAHPNVTPSQDSVTVKLGTDSPIDLHAITWDPTLHYLSAVDSDGNPKPVFDSHGNPITTLTMTPEIEQYPGSSSTTISSPWTSTTGTTRDATVTFTRGADSKAGTAIVTVKTLTGVVARHAVNIPAALLGGDYAADVDLNAALTSGTDYWFDVSIRAPEVSDKVGLAGFTLKEIDASQPAIDVPATLHWTGRQGIFPLAYRGWAVAGYNGNDSRATEAIVESDFVIDPNTLPTTTQTPQGFNDPNYQPPKQDKSFAYLPAVQSVALPGLPAPLPTEVWVGNRANLVASAGRARSSRLGSDTVSIGTPAGGSSRAVTRVSITAPSAKLAFGIGPLGASFGVSPSFGLVDYQDMNGDGYPDVITPNSVVYTTPRGAYLPAGQDPGQLAVTNQDLTFAVSAGIESGLVDIKANAKGKTNATQGSAAGKGSDAEDSGGGVGVGVSLDVSWTSPNASGPSDSPIQSTGTTDPGATYADQLNQTPDGPPGDTAPIQLGLADVNGDGLPDRVFATPQGVFARYNLGYAFASAPVKLATGGFESQESYAGGLSLGFSTPWADFSGGAALNWNVDLSRYAWVDVNGDGILDQLHKINNTDPPTVRFGTGSGMLAPKTYGTMADAHITDQIDAGQQVSLDRTTGVGGQFDFTIGIGPLCIVACYLIINPGASYQNSVSSTEIDLQDVNGDGFADSVQTLDDNSLKVSLNKQDDTNLLSTVTNPLGGTIALRYAREGNTVDSPDSVWTLSRVDVNDGRPGDGVDVQRTRFAYEGLRSDRLHRDSLGFAAATATEIDTGANPPVALRSTRHEYQNDNVFDAGLETRTLISDARTGDWLSGVKQTWSLRDVRGGADLTKLDSVASLGYSIAPLLTSVVQEVYDTGNVVGQSSTTELTYDDLGDVIQQADRGEDDDPNDDVVASYIYSRCDISSTIGCVDASLPHPSPIWNANLCPTWVSLPVVFDVTNGLTGANLKTYRHRDGRSEICNNASVTHLEETIGTGSLAVTDLSYDAWGSYDRIVYPADANGHRYAVHYEWDQDRHADIAKVTEYELAGTRDDVDPTYGLPLSSVAAFLGDFAADDFGPFQPPAPVPPLPATPPVEEGLTSWATFDPLSGRVATRTDANLNVTRYTYDALARIKSISSPRASDPLPLVTYDYFPQATDAYAVAHHYDSFHPGDTLDTATFVDGTGRVVQTKRDASLFVSAGQPATTGIIVSGTTMFDALGRPVSQYNPGASTLPLGTYDATPPGANDPHTDTVYDLYDMPNTITEPGGRVTTIDYEYGQVGTGPQLYRTTETAPNGRQTIVYTDVRDVVRAVTDAPDAAPAQTTTYDYDGMGQLLQVVDPTGYVTTHAYDLMGRLTSTTTPDGGTVDFGFDADGQQVTKVTPNLRALGQQINYQYDLHQLTRIDYPAGTPDVTYTYGGMGAPGNGAGQLVSSDDGARILTNTYDAAGNIVDQTAEMKLHRWYTPDADPTDFQWRTQWQYDGLGRLESMVYPDGEQLSYGYDAGGLVNSISGQEDGYTTVLTGYDADGNPIYQQVPTTWHYEYLRDQQYDVFLRRRYEELGNGVTTEFTFDPNTQWLSNQLTISPNRDVQGQGAAYTEIQDLNYTYDAVGNPTEYRNDLPPAVSNLFSGPTSESYTYDPYERVTGATGAFQLSTSKLQHYSLTLGYDTRGNVVSKTQLDQIQNGKKELTQSKTSYSFTRTYNQVQPHQATAVDKDTYSYDADGNLLGIKDAKGKWIRAITWDASDRMRTVTDGPSLTDYTYDDTGQRAIERGPAGETAFINPYVTVRNENEMWKNIWAGDERLGTQKDDGGNQELDQYFLHKDLQGSTNVVTDVNGNTFQHHEYFATGEVWIDDKSTVFRTPYQYAGGYVDEVRGIINFGDRWYDPSRELLYAPDPVLTNDAMAVVSEPSLRAAYSYAGSNPLTYVDPTGLQFTPAQAKAFIKANMKEARALVAQNPALRARLEQNLQTRLPKSLVRLGLDIESADLNQKRFKMLDDIAKPFVEFNVSTGKVQLSLGLFKQWTVRKGNEPPDPSSPDNVANGTQDATNGKGGPASVASGTTAGAQDSATAPTRPRTPAPADTGKAPPPASGNAPPPPAPRKDTGGTSAKGSL